MPAKHMMLPEFSMLVSIERGWRFIPVNQGVVCLYVQSAMVFDKRFFKGTC